MSPVNCYSASVVRRTAFIAAWFFEQDIGWKRRALNHWRQSRRGKSTLVGDAKRTGFERPVSEVGLTVPIGQFQFWEQANAGQEDSFSSNYLS
jgi:hypothetical protein